MINFFFIILYFSSLAWSDDQTYTLPGVQVIGHNETTSLIDIDSLATKIEGKDLNKKRQTSLGDTLQNEASVTSTSFGPNASRPVIRGLDGDRIRILQNGLGTLDASTQSLDHAIPVDTLTLESIEIVRGPMSLLYGSSAVGGVVNLVTNRVHTKFEEGAHASALLQGETVSDGLSTGALLNYGKKNWMIHVDGSTRNLQDQKIPKYARSSHARKTPLPADEKEGKKKILNSFNQQDSLALGVSRIFDKGYLGVSLNHFKTEYGTVAEQNVLIDMLQNRYELHGEFRPDNGLINKVRIKSAQTVYNHKEIDDGATGTQFKNGGNESRLEFFNKKNEVEGVSGIQTQVSQFSAKGDEAFLPSTSSDKFAVFTFQKLKKQNASYSSGVRYEFTQVHKNGSSEFGDKENKDFNSFNGSLGHELKFGQDQLVTTNFSYTERAPNFQELFAEGEHLATGTYEIGDKGLSKEKAYGLEVNLKSGGVKNNISVSLFSQIFNDYIFLNPTGQQNSGLDEYLHKQDNALFYGGDVEAKNQIAEWNRGQFNLTSKFDIVRAKNTSDGHNLPRISPPRLSAGLEYTKERWSTDLEVQYVFQQTKTAVDERRTDAYTLTNFGMSYDFLGSDSALTAFGRVRNIFDVEARSHVSFLKELTPMPGRNFIVGLQYQI